mgnify:CR=1 FL=1
MKVGVKKAVNEVRFQPWGVVLLEEGGCLPGLGVSYYSHSTVPGGFEVIS